MEKPFIYSMIPENLNPDRCVRGIIPFIIAGNGSKLVICEDSKDALAFQSAVEIFNPGKYYYIDRYDETALPLLNGLAEGSISLVSGPDIYSALFPDRSSLASSVITFRKGMIIDDDLTEYLEDCGLSRVDNVYEKGEYAVRGFVIDVYAFHSGPVRIELYDNEIESIRGFDVGTQLSTADMETFSMHIPRKTADVEFSEFIKGIEVIDLPDLIYKARPDHKICEDIDFSGGHIGNFIDWASKYTNYDVHVFASSGYEAARLAKVFKDKITVHRGNIYAGFILHASKLICINDFEIFKRARMFSLDFEGFAPVLMEDIDALQPGDIVVHQVHGIGRFAGIEKVSIGNRFSDCLKIYYRDNDKLYVPVDQIYLIDKYYGTSTDNVNLSSLTKKHFEQQKNKVRESLKQIAGELIRLYAERELVSGIEYPADDEMQIDMESHFSFEETPDQISAIEDVKNDMEKARPMDRLICGEVGFGKTEVAARAAFKAILAGRQVCILVPTTILAEQHFRTLTERFRDYPVTVEMISRFRKQKEKSVVIKGLSEGKINLIIGTHSLLSSNMEYADLGLLIIDEEHRFGVKQKEMIKEMKRNIDVLSMSATPIPRTLEMAFSGIKDISNILTPPIGRQPVETYLIKWNDSIIRDALLREKERGGQIYFVHNRIETLPDIERKLRKLVPECRIVTAHAKLQSAKLEKIMVDFWERKFDILLSTAIIESGIDNPDANTMFINRGDMFGLAQLHQLRGRIGRSKRDAHCYVIVPGKSSITDNARKRLTAFKSYSSLGAGMKLAMKDLEIRGAGNLLGTQQHGNIGIVGFSLYFKLLAQAIDELKGIKKPDIIEPVINIPVKTYIPDDFKISRTGKTALYREIAGIKNAEDIPEATGKFRDRYGRMPEEIMNMYKLQEVKLMAKSARISRIFSSKGLVIEFFLSYEPSINVINRMLSSVNSDFEVKYGNPFKIILKNAQADIDTVKMLLKSLI